MISKRSNPWRSLGFFVLVACVIGGVGWTFFRTERQLSTFLSPQLEPVPARKTTHRVTRTPESGAAVFAHVGACRDVVATPGGFFLATDVGLVRVTTDGAAIFHRGGGLPASRVISVALLGERVHALSPEGLLVVRAADDEHLTVDRYALRDGARLLAMTADGDTATLLDDQGRILRFAAGEFGLVTQAPKLAAARLARLGDRVAVAAPTGELWSIAGTGSTAQRRNLWPAEIAPQSILALADDARGLLVGTPAGLWRVDRFAAAPLLEGFAVSAVAVHRDTIWLGGPAGELRTLEGDRVFSLGAAVQGLRAQGDALLAVTDDGLWSLSKGGDPQRVTPAAWLSPLPDSYVTALLPRSDGKVLVGGLNRGLAELDPATGRVQRVALASLGINRLVAFEGSIWAATTNGLARLNADLSVKKMYTDADGLPHRYVASVLPGRRGVLAATSGGLAEISSSGIRAINAFHGLAGNHLYCLADFGEVVAAGGLAGMTLVDTSAGLRAVRNLTATRGGLPHNWVHAAVAVENRLLVGTYGGGIAVVSKEGPARPVADTAGISINPEAVAVRGDVVAFGTLDRGVLVGRGERWVSLDRALPSRNVTALASDGENLWIGTDHGLARVPWAWLVGAAQ